MIPLSITLNRRKSVYNYSTNKRSNNMTTSENKEEIVPTPFPPTEEEMQPKPMLVDPNRIPTNQMLREQANATKHEDFQFRDGLTV